MKLGMRGWRVLLIASSFALCGATVSAGADNRLSPGQIVFIKECAKCHQVGPNARNRIGPVLNAIFGKRAGTVEGFRNYSEAMRRSGIIWTPEHFRLFIRDPKSIIEGTTQIYKGLKDEQSITALIEFLKTQ